MAYLEVKNFNKSFDGTKVLKDVCFSMEKGEVLSVIGSSGSGKTTALRCLVGLETPDSGEAVVDGKRIIPRDKNTAGDEIGMVFQSFNLFPQYAVLKNVTLAMDVRSEKLLKKQKLGFSERNRLLKEAKAANREKALVLLEKVGLSDKAASYPWQLSGGPKPASRHCPRPRASTVHSVLRRTHQRARSSFDAGSAGSHSFA